ncbi:serine/threonine-protein kinase pim-2-like [Carassius gibelio]|uniref:serine/threonine-protein kinase pim-2-like n=1 Tax=Carassius gibelio TaxID=101364 RepID=UPI00227943FB|nr:serine/threonine-protein kinase pim-2-like [Carassius gibelio]
MSVCSSAGKDTDDSFVSAVTSIAHSAVASAGSLIVHQDVNSVVRPKAEREVASVEHSKIDEGFNRAVLPKEDGGIASARNPQVDMGIASAVCTPVDSVATGELDKGNFTAIPQNSCNIIKFDVIYVYLYLTDHICWRYKFGGRLGEGGFGSVRKGTRVKDGLKVAVKYVKKTKHTKYISTAFHPKPLPLEIALAVIINRKPSCPHIIEMLDWQDDPDYYLIVMERPVPSMDMAKLLKCNGGVLNEQIAKYLMWQVIYAANFCLNRGIFHRDIKLENVLVNPTTLEIKLIDFGCGNLVKDSGYSTCLGTKPYIPPEYHDRGRYHAKPATVYSLGVLLFTMLHGRFPKDRDLYCLGSNQSVFAVSQECIQFLWACLQCNPEHRIALEQMLYNDWFVLGFPNPLPINRKASKQHSHY